MVLKFDMENISLDHREMNVEKKLKYMMAKQKTQESLTLNLELTLPAVFAGREKLLYEKNKNPHKCYIF